MKKEQRAKKWFITYLIGQFGVLFCIALAVWVIDPYFHYHKPIKGISYRLYEERYVNDGIARNFEYDAIITGTSMTQNFKTSQFDSQFGTKSVKLPFSGAGFQELCENLERALSYNEAVNRVFMCLDYNGLNREYDWTQYEDYPAYLYDDNPFNDVSYLFNKSILYRGCLTNLFFTVTGTPSTTFDEYSAWGSAYGFEQIVQTYTRKEKREEETPGLSVEEAERVRLNIEQNILPLLEKHPDVTFYFFYSPYSILYWDELYMNGNLEKQLQAEELTTDLLLAYDNVQLYSFFENTQLICNLDNYRDKEHYISDINGYMLEQISQGNYRITEENIDSYRAFMREFYLHFDYDRFYAEQEKKAKNKEG